MYDKLSRARHRRLDESMPSRESSSCGRHAGVDKTLLSNEESSEAPPEKEEDKVASVSASAALMGICTVASRITGFARTWVMAFALGSTLLSSSYQVANNLPYQLYELVAGGVLVTAFLPVYLSVKGKLGEKAGNDYASSLLTIVVFFLGVVSVLCMAYPQVAIYTQSFYSDQSEMGQSVFLFRFFAIQIVLYGATSIVSGLLNANRDYLWSSIAPVANNVIVIATFALYVVAAPINAELALYIIAIGNPFGVFVQLAMQLPALKRNGIRLRPYVNLHDPALKDTLKLGVPAVFVMVCSLATVSVQNAASYSFSESGPSILLYARQWFTLPYAFLAVPITTAMFTELSDMQGRGDTHGVKQGIVSATNQIIFLMIPFALYLIVFSVPLVTLYHAGAFTMESVMSIASYLSVLAIALPAYGVNTYLQKIFSSLRKMGVFAIVNFVASFIQIVVIVVGVEMEGVFPIEIIAVSSIAFYLVADVCLFAYLRRSLGALGLGSMARSCAGGLLFGLLGALAGAGVLFALQGFVSPLSGSILQALIYVLAGGMVSLLVTFGLAIAFKVPEVAPVQSLCRRLLGKLGFSARAR